MKWNIHNKKYDRSWSEADMTEQLFEWLILHGDSEVELHQLQGWMSEAIHFKYLNHRMVSSIVDEPYIGGLPKHLRVLHYIRISIKGKRIATMRKVEYE